MAYKNNPLDDIVKCDIEISSPGSSDATFDSILLVVNAPSGTGKKEMKKVTSVSGADELLDYGFTTDDTAYKATSVAFSQNPSPSELLVCIRKTIKESSDTTDDTITTESDTEDDAVMTESSGYEDIQITLTRAASETGFYGIHITEFGRNKEDIKKAVAWTESNEKLLGVEYIDYDGFLIKNTSYYRSFCIYSGSADGYDEKEQPSENQYAALAWMAKCFGYDPGTETWHMKELAAIVPSVLGTSEKKDLAEANTSTFLRYAGCNVTIGGKTLAGEWIDVIRFRDWLKNELQINVFNVIKTNRKVPFTDAGIGLIQGAMYQVLSKGQKIGGIAETEYDSDGNPLYGFEITVPKASDFTEAERKSRKLTNCKWIARLAGAIHAVEISGYLAF